MQARGKFKSPVWTGLGGKLLRSRRITIPPVAAGYDDDFPALARVADLGSLGGLRSLLDDNGGGLNHYRLNHDWGRFRIVLRWTGQHADVHMARRLGSNLSLQLLDLRSESSFGPLGVAIAKLVDFSLGLVDVVDLIHGLLCLAVEHATASKDQSRE